MANKSEAQPQQEKELKQGNGPQVTIRPLNRQEATFNIIGTSPFVQHAFGRKALTKIIATQEAGTVAKGKKVREPKDFKACYEEACHVAGGENGGWYGIPAPAFRNAMISACKVAGYVMTRAKLALIVKADGYDRADGSPLVRITKGEPHMDQRYARNDDGSCDVRARPMWGPGWEAQVTVVFDGDILTLEDVANLLERAGLQVGVGEGRNDSPNSCGMGWGSFQLKREAQTQQKAA